MIHKASMSEIKWTLQSKGGGGGGLRGLHTGICTCGFFTRYSLGPLWTDRAVWVFRALLGKPGARLGGHDLTAPLNPAVHDSPTSTEPIYIQHTQANGHGRMLLLLLSWKSKNQNDRKQRWGSGGMTVKAHCH